MRSPLECRLWMKRALVAAGVYNLLWGFVTVAFPERTLTLLGVDPAPLYPQFWQCIGMIVGVYGVGYLIAARDPHRHWPIVLVGLLGKLFGPVGFVSSLLNGGLPLKMGLTILANDVVWWAPFSLILFDALRHHRSSESAYAMPEADDPLRDLKSQHGERLDDLANQRPQLVVFLRHAGCTFCRETLSDLARHRDAIESTDTGIVLVHMGDNARNAVFFEKFGLGDVPRLADPGCRLYRQFGLDLGGFAQLFGPQVWLRGLIAGLIRGHGIGRLQGNGFQMPGAYVYHCGQIVAGYLHRSASDRPDYLALVRRSENPMHAAAV